MLQSQINQAKTIIIAIIVSLFAASAAFAGPANYPPFNKTEKSSGDYIYVHVDNVLGIDNYRSFSYIDFLKSDKNRFIEGERLVKLKKSLIISIDLFMGKYQVKYKGKISVEDSFPWDKF